MNYKLMLATIFLAATSTLWAKPVAVFTMVVGKVQIKEADDRWISAVPGMKVSEKAEIQTALKSKATLQFPNGNLLNIAPGSIVSIDKLVAGTYGTATDVSLTLGKVVAVIAKPSSEEQRNHFRVRTPTAVAGVRGSVQEVGYSPEQGTSVKMLENAADVVSNNGTKVAVPQGGEAKISSDSLQTPDQIANKNSTVIFSNNSTSSKESEFLLNASDITFSSAASDFTDFFKLFDQLFDEIYQETTVPIEFERL